VMRVFLCLVVTLLTLGCRGNLGSNSAAESEQPLPVPIRMRVSQRSTTQVPETEGAIRLTIDDITRNQVMTALADEGGNVVLATTSLAPGDSAAFQFRGHRYQLTLSHLDTAMLGEDF